MDIELEKKTKKLAVEGISAMPMATPGSPVSAPAAGIAAPPERISRETQGPLMINGIAHQRLPDQKFPGPLSIAAGAAVDTVAHIATAPFGNRTDERLATNRRELNNETAEPQAPRADQAEADRIRAAHKGILAASPSFATTLSSTKNAPAVDGGITGGLRVTAMPAGSTAPMGSGFDAAGKQLGGRDIAGQKLFTNVGGDGTAGMSALSANTQGIAGMPQGNPNLGTADDNMRQIANIQALRESTPQGGIGILGDGGIEAANEEKTRRWAMEDAVRKAPESQRAALMIASMNHDQTNQTTRRGQDMASATAATGAGITARGQDLNAQSNANRMAGNAQDNQLKSAQAKGIMAQNDSTAMIAEIQKKAIAGDAQAMVTYRALTGKTAQSATDRFMTVQGGEEIGPDGMTKIKRPGGVFDAQTQKFMPMNGDQQKAQASDAAGKIKADMAAGKISRDDAVKQLKAMGYQ